MARHADRARAELRALPDSPARRALDGLVVTVVDRALQGQQPSLVGSR